ncbi:protein kinase, putative [Trypanosoma brucei brucei TREU927]|uniref:non-specific serine/threonine protein kinase n=1 Tax=Trypanosoma brucei brucei (strain 927/4 GUTat10.1) TaxID=185431 RepID=Q57Z77_TRYB2|nr:protein kinase, putative [Trypanosoma brucei brucei TREU927]AAX79556.1 protein kinase, putative [Trypanosoma brucei]AAZ11429.1 protein kinase, putative [Trypanosoma brucei brucei TREU927]
MTTTPGGRMVLVRYCLFLRIWALLLLSLTSRYSLAAPLRATPARRHESANAVQAVSSLLDDDTDQTTVTFTGWSPSKASLNVTGILPSAVSMGRYVLIVGGTRLVRPFTSAENFVRYYALTTISALDITTETFVTPMMFQDNATFAHDGSGSETFHGRTKGDVRVPAKLHFPAVGTSNAVRLGSTVYVIGFCTMLPYGVRPGRGQTINATLRSVQVIRLYQQQFPPVDDLSMDIQHISIPDTATLRFNASCVGNGNGTIYIVGGVSLIDGNPMTSVSQFNTVTGQFVDAGWGLGTSLITPGVVDNSELVFIGGGCRDYRGWPEYNDNVYVVDPTYFTADVGQFDSELLDWLSPQLMIYNRTLAMIAATYRRSFDRLESWVDLSGPGSDATDVMIGFAPLRTNAVIASVPNADGMSLYLIGGQIPPPDGTGISRDLFTGNVHVADGHADVTVQGFNYISVADDATHRQMLGIARSGEGGQIVEAKFSKGDTTEVDSISHTGQSVLDDPFHDEEQPTANATMHDQPTPPPADLPNKDGNWTVHVNGYKPLWYNFTFAILLSEQISTACQGINATGEVSGNLTSSTCLLRLSDSPACNSVLLNLGNLSFANTWPYVVNMTDPGKNVSAVVNTVAVGPITLTGSLINGIHNITTPYINTSTTHRDEFVFHPRPTQRSFGNDTDNVFYEQLFVYVCFSTGAATVQRCNERAVHESSSSMLRAPHVPLGAMDAHQGPCTTGFYRPLNANDPFVLSPVTHWVPDPPGPQPVPPPAVEPLYLVGVAVGCGVSLVLWSASMISYAIRHKHGKEVDVTVVEGCFSEDESGDYDDENDDKSRHRRGFGPGAALPVHQKQSLLDGKYRVLRRLGRGGFSVVYLVERVMDGERFALKYVQCADDMDRHEAMRECEVAYTLQGHPNVICLVDMFMSYRFDTHLPTSDGVDGRKGAYRRQCRGELLLHDPTRIHRVGSGDESESHVPSHRPQAGERYLSLVMAYHERGDLGMWVRQQKSEPKIPEKTVVSIAFQILTVLQFMHQQKPPIIHRDLKPENILLDSSPAVKRGRNRDRYDRVDWSSKNSSGRIGTGASEETLRIVVTDFGLSRVMDKTFCETGVGSLPYVAPECWQRHYSTKVDIWATGCILYAVCAKRVESDNVKVMFSESNKPDFKKKLLEELTQVYGYSMALAAFIVYLLEPDPARRPSAEEALRFIRRRRKGTDGLTEEAAMVTVYKGDDDVASGCSDEEGNGAEGGIMHDDSYKQLVAATSEEVSGYGGESRAPVSGQGSDVVCGTLKSTSFSTHRSGATVEVVTPSGGAGEGFGLNSPPPKAVESQNMPPITSFSHGSHADSSQGMRQEHHNTMDVPPVARAHKLGSPNGRRSRRLQVLQQYFETVAEEGEQCEFFIARESPSLVATSLNSSKRESPVPLTVSKNV